MPSQTPNLACSLEDTPETTALRPRVHELASGDEPTSQSFTSSPGTDMASAMSLRHQRTSSQDNVDITGLERLGLLQFLEKDIRPTFIVELKNCSSEILPLAFRNSALIARPDLMRSVTGRDLNKTGAPALRPNVGFRKWLQGHGSTAGFLFSNTIWSNTTVDNRWAIVSGVPYHVADSAGDYSFVSGKSGARVQSHDTSWSNMERDNIDELVDSSGVVSSLHASVQLPSESRAMLDNLVDSRSTEVDAEASPTSVKYDCVAPTCTKLTRHMEFFRNLDWASTALGPMEHWDSHIRQMVNLVMDDINPSVSADA